MNKLSLVLCQRNKRQSGRNSFIQRSQNNNAQAHGYLHSVYD
ncbi:hypothetical protein T12_2196 [Trichinella patagoniensis]|uniref:Uncharacterized protein n=1 Tax=Trichinella patagoniensis TaxID=990121 RepID=A0A0V0YUA6_9BILA|nr:hypothetical protein T12_2196 [Trichinella patagoniensis]